MQWVDIGIIAIITLSLITGLFRGLVKEFISITVWIMAIWLSINYAHLLDPWLKQYIKQDGIRSAAAFMVILFSTLLVGGVINATIHFVLRRTGLNGTDRLLGMGFGFVRGILIISVVIAGLRVTGMPESDYRKDSMFYAKFDPVVNWVGSFMPTFIEKVKSIEKVPETTPTSIALDL